MSDLPPLPSEQLLIDHLACSNRKPLASAIVMSPGRGQAANALIAAFPNSKITSWFVDLHRAERARKVTSEDVHVICQPDLPDTTWELALLPVLKTGEAEMNRDLIYQSWQRLTLGGELIAAVNSPKDTWLLNQLQALGPKVRCHDHATGRVYVVRKSVEAFKPKTFDAEFTHRVDDRILTVHSRPSVFSHRSVDRAAAAMIRHAPIPEGSTVLELGCGNGAVAMAAAMRSKTGHAYAVDCNSRAVQCTERAAAQNQITNLTAIVNHDGELPTVPPCDIALLNPPYYGDFRIAEHFMVTAAKKLRSGGEAYVITKQTDRYLEYDWWPLEMTERKTAQSYDLLRFTRE